MPACSVVAAPVPGFGRCRRALELRQVHLPQPDVSVRVEPAGLGHRPRVGQQSRSAPGAAGHGGEVGSDGGHLIPRFQPALGVAAINVASGQRHQTAGRVEDVAGGSLGTVDHPYVVGEHCT